MMRIFPKLMIVLLFSLTFSGSEVYADAPKSINYQGYLTDNASLPINGARSMVFSLYNSSIGGTPLWTETQPAVTVNNGIYQVDLGSVTPFNLSFNQQYFLGITVGADPELVPRQALTSAPYALGLAPGSNVTLTDSSSNSTALSVASSSSNANAFSVTKTGLNGNGGSFAINEATNNFAAVYGFTQGTGASIYGVATTGASAGQFDVSGATNPKPALLAQTSGTGNAGRFLINNSGSTNNAVYAITSGSGYGVWAGSNSGIGIYGSSATSNGVFGITSNGVTGVTGRADNVSGIGVYGVNWANGTNGSLGSNYGVSGIGNSVVGVKGQSTSASGVWGASATSHGVYGENTSGSSGVAGVYGSANSTTGTTYGVMGTCAGNTSYAVYGSHSTSNNYGYLGTNGYGAFGRYNATGNYGGLGGATAGVFGSGANGVYAVNSSNTAINAYLATPSYAGDFSGDVRVKGDIKSEYVAGSPRNAVPVAYGTINSNATIAAGSGNFTVTYNSTSAWYEITITGENYHYMSHQALVTPVAITPRIAVTSSVSDRLIVVIYNTADVKQQNMFNFVVYRP